MISIKGTIPIRIYPVFFLIAGLIGFLYSGSVAGTLVWIAVILVSVLVHEFGHALTAQYFGQTVRIDLVGFGGLTHHTGKILKPWQNFIVVLDGPLAGFFLCFIAFFLLRLVPENGLLVYGLTIAVYVNLFWTVVNLLPIQPLDGGKLLSIIFEKIFGYKGVRYSYMFSGLLSVAFSMIFFALGAIIAGAIFFLFAFESYRAWSELKNLTALDRDTDLQKMFKLADESMEVGNYAEAEAELEKILQKTDKGVIHNAAVEMLGKLYFSRGENEKAFELLYPIRDSLSPEMLDILHKILGALGKWDEALKLGERAYSESPGYELALINSSASAFKGDREAAIGWLQRAADDGAENIEDYIKRPEFDSIRQDIVEDMKL
jgi:stage IV sporulation protein FB